MINRTILAILLLSFVFTGLVHSSGEEKDFLLIYTGDVRGYVEGCG